MKRVIGNKVFQVEVQTQELDWETCNNNVFSEISQCVSSLNSTAPVYEHDDYKYKLSPPPHKLFNDTELSNKDSSHTSKGNLMYFFTVWGVVLLTLK